MAYADSPTGPFTVHPPGVLDMRATPFNRHIASPDAWVDEENRRIHMHYHGAGCIGPNPLPYFQVTCHASSTDGLLFQSDRTYLAPSYLRTFRYGGWHYGFSGGVERCFFRARAPDRAFEAGGVVEIAGEQFNVDPATGEVAETEPVARRMRHVGLHRQGETLEVYYSCVGDSPERIKCTLVDLRGDWTAWRGAEFQEVLRPETIWEGVELPMACSSSGSVHEPVHQLRDPFVFEEEGRKYLFYSVAGERGIAVAELLDAAL